MYDERIQTRLYVYRPERRIWPDPNAIPPHPVFELCAACLLQSEFRLSHQYLLVHFCNTITHQSPSALHKLLPWPAAVRFWLLSYQLQGHLRVWKGEEEVLLCAFGTDEMQSEPSMSFYFLNPTFWLLLYLSFFRADDFLSYAPKAALFCILSKCCSTFKLNESDLNSFT